MGFYPNTACRLKQIATLQQRVCASHEDRDLAMTPGSLVAGDLAIIGARADTLWRRGSGQ